MAFSLSATDTHRQTATRAMPEVVRCACAVCGAHTNAVRTVRVTGTCPNCGSFDLSAIDGAEPLGGTVAR